MQLSADWLLSPGNAGDARFRFSMPFRGFMDRFFLLLNNIPSYG